MKVSHTSTLQIFSKFFYCNSECIFEACYQLTLNVESTFELICQALGYSTDTGLIKKETYIEDFENNKILNEAIYKFNVDAVFLIKRGEKEKGIPVIYFKKIEKYDINILIDLHKKIWNQGKIPLLFVVSPNEIKIYNCFEPPTSPNNFNNEDRLISHLENIVSIEKIREKLSSYTFEKISSGIFWKEQKEKFNFNNRADNHLLRNLDVLRIKLKDTKLKQNIIHKLIGRCLFILYLQDKNILNVFLDDFIEKNFMEILNSKTNTFKLFNIVNEHFNGNVFPISDEELQLINEKHLKLIKRFLEGTNLETGQTVLWPYRFDIIPVEFLSNVYEQFFQTKKSEDANELWVGTHYTPQFLVDLMISDVFEKNISNFDIKILDPSCGSGIFLVEVYRRLIEQYKIKNKKIEIKDLSMLLENCIYGVDINDEAILITAFNLYLVMLDYIEPVDVIKNKKIFPKLIEKTLFPVDFFDFKSEFNKMHFNYIIGNIPWESITNEKNTNAIKYCQLKQKPIGDKQLAQAFLWKSLELCTEDGQICILTGSKSLLFNRGSKNLLFRSKFIQEAQIQSIINLSSIRRNIFNKAVGPASIILYGPRKTPYENYNIEYITPKPSWETRYIGAIVINPSDYYEIPSDAALANDTIWKIAMWGTPRDYDLILKSQKKGTIDNFRIRYQLEIGDGFQKHGSDRNYAPWIAKMPHIPPKALTKYYVDKIQCINITDVYFHRPRPRNRYKSPLSLLKVTLNDGEILSSFSDFDVTYTDGIIGISGYTKESLIILTCYLNSKLAKYFLFLTCSVWGVERDDILKDDLYKMPFILPEKNTFEYNRILDIFDQLKISNSRHEDLINELDNIYFNLFNIDDIEKAIINDTYNYVIDYYQKQDGSNANTNTDELFLIDYSEAFLKIINNIFIDNKQIFNSKIYFGNNDLVAILFYISNEKENILIINNKEELNKILSQLNMYVKNKNNKNIYYQKVIKIYEKNVFYLIKTNEKRFWTRKNAYKDADDIISEILQIKVDSE